MKLRLLAAIAAALAFAPPPAAAHDVPADVTVQAFLKPEGQRLRLLVRAPLAAMRDVSFPTRGPVYLDLANVDAPLRQAANLWIAEAVELYEDDTRLPSPRIVAARVSLPSDGSFGSYEDTLAHVTGPPLPDDTELYWSQGMLDVLFEYPIHSEGSRFSIQSGFGRLGLRVVTGLRFLPPGGAVRAFELEGDPGLVRLDPRWHQAALRFVELENIVAPQLRRRWMITFAFGLVHGFGFSFAFQQTLQFAGSHPLTSLLSFNVGVELGQLLVLVLLVPALNLLFRRVPERTGTIVLSALVAHTGWHWMVERWDRVRQFRFPWPALDAAPLASATRWLMLAVIAAGLVWLVFGVLRAPARRRAEKEAE